MFGHIRLESEIDATRFTWASALVSGPSTFRIQVHRCSGLWLFSGVVILDVEERATDMITREAEASIKGAKELRSYTPPHFNLANSLLNTQYIGQAWNQRPGIRGGRLFRAC